MIKSPRIVIIGGGSISDNIIKGILLEAGVHACCYLNEKDHLKDKVKALQEDIVYKSEEHKKSFRDLKNYKAIYNSKHKHFLRF